MKEKGDPVKNGHVVTVSPGGKKPVLVPAKHGRVTRGVVRSAKLDRVVDSGGVSLSQPDMMFTSASRILFSEGGCGGLVGIWLA